MRNRIDALTRGEAPPPELRGKAAEVIADACLDGLGWVFPAAQDIVLTFRPAPGLDPVRVEIPGYELD
jgi:hypothetical protein